MAIKKFSRKKDLIVYVKNKKMLYISERDVEALHKTFKSFHKEGEIKADTEIITAIPITPDKKGERIIYKIDWKFIKKWQKNSNIK